MGAVGARLGVHEFEAAAACPEEHLRTDTDTGGAASSAQLEGFAGARGGGEERCGNAPGKAPGKLGRAPLAGSP